MDPTTFQLEAALMIYETYTADYKQEFYLELHKVKDGVLLAGSPVSRDAVKAVWESCYEKARAVRDEGLLPGNLLFNFAGQVAWHIPAGRHHLTFSKHLAIPSGMAHCPALLFVAGSGPFKIYALKRSSRPNENTKLYHAPFHNVYAKGGVCMGSARQPLKGIPIRQYIRGMEAAFFNSEFNSTFGQPLKGKRNINTLWKRLVETGEKFPNDALRDTKQRLGDIL